ncbi:DUF1918 domain-containing protein [Lentzea sp. NBC_00516]|jgi:hypothetical protein|uniref:DUF1918 domain-containing protein n=1 Tax=Lentzea sokolovensis TaxID=3095429 RepID=A0ABU4UPK3_9PSEU|nr:MULTISPECIES: DUF1918 domain-containing protein [unclassified Lentzea]MDX8141418.1 DUF1918 domain-containing protein [Lentzea sp. BCCO 10_0061]WUD27241.1 DUF1918 domain-containing protein [Lentzea sp. NBC_00516]
MKAKVNDWLVVKGAVVDRGGRRGQIVALRHEDGTPPYVVRWLDTGHEGLVFPGPDAHVITAEDEAARLRAG